MIHCLLTPSVSDEKYSFILNIVSWSYYLFVCVRDFQDFLCTSVFQQSRMYLSTVLFTEFILLGIC